jgi:phage baseplate assembly protein W
MSRESFYTLERKKTVIYNDFFNSFSKNPITGFLAVKTNEEAVKQAVKNIVLTQLGERFYDSNKGSKIRAVLFELFDPATEEFAKLQLSHAIRSYEPRVQDLAIEFYNDADKNGLGIIIHFTIANLLSEPVNLNIFVRRIR